MLHLCPTTFLRFKKTYRGLMTFRELSVVRRTWIHLCTRSTPPAPAQAPARGQEQPWSPQCARRQQIASPRNWCRAAAPLQKSLLYPWTDLLKPKESPFFSWTYPQGCVMLCYAVSQTCCACRPKRGRACFPVPSCSCLSNHSKEKNTLK